MRFKSIIICFTLVLPIASCAKQEPNNVADEQSKNFFSLTELKQAEIKRAELKKSGLKNASESLLQPISVMQATDDVSLAYRAYLPEQAQAILIFYHGGGAHSGLSYHHIGTGLRNDFDIAVYMPDIRGHGASGGERGDAPNVEQVWSDINTMVNTARDTYPDLPIFIGGHSAGAGLALNYSSWDEKAEIEGYAFLAPYFGYRSKTNYDEGDSEVEFSSVTVSDFVINTLSGGLLLGHSKAVKFNFPDAVLKANPEIVPFNTVNMANAVTPHSPESQFSDVEKFGLWIGKQDEAFDPLKVIMFAQDNSATKAKKEIEMIDNANHFSIILNGSDLIGPWLQKTLE
ncbi:alpha/beta fold hydrolase [Psychromonas sp. Urea-02u-13]|uniref:alpha/beta fold hydrolase n=1 Tax=Psychromonas sp. Urea-02u-13 TaxID=2058326 RepID=UPI000C323279|nr:alpha/beta fold hydrolase [Psychromonas sp. Urea-02u-13]PKG37477.1 alpha/beta hydrolase [Psychromonas sp. Urea-02u-13]